MRLVAGRAVAGAALIVAVAGYCYGVAGTFNSPAETSSTFDSMYPVDRLIQFKVSVANRSADYIPHARVFVDAPIKQTSSQLVKGISASTPYIVTADEYGHQRLEFMLNDVAPFALSEIKVSVEMAFAHTPNRAARVDEDRFRRSSRYIEASDPTIGGMARQLARDDLLATSESLFSWVATNIEYAGYIAPDLGAKYALEHRRGDCTEYAYLYAALARANDIPTRAIAGYVLRDTSTLRSEDFHNWSESLLAERWTIVDPQKKVFNDSYKNYLAVRVIADDPAGQENGVARFWADDKRLQVAMK